MRSDIDAALSVLDLTDKLLEQARSSAAPYRVHTEILAFALALRENVVLRDALEELVLHEGADEKAKVEAYRMWLSERGQKLCYEIGDAIASLEPSTQSHFNATQVSPRRKIGLVAFFTAYRPVSRLKPVILEIEEYASLSLSLSSSLELLLDPGTAEIEGWAMKLEGLVREISGRFQLMERIAEQRSVERTARRLQETVGVWSSHPEAIGNQRGPVDVTPDIIDVSALIARLRHQLLLRRPVAHALRRLKAYLEHFAHSEVRRALEDEEAKPRPLREQALQRFIDRFLFEQGFFPLTQFEASRGRLDTLVAAASNTREQPILIELKQIASVIDETKVTSKLVEESVEMARPEIERYLGHVRSQLAWAHVEPAIIVVHTCPTPIAFVPTPDVVLIDISSKTPSQLGR